VAQHSVQRVVVDGMLREQHEVVDIDVDEV
jgi:hypothetical protein